MFFVFFMVGLSIHPQDEDYGQKNTAHLKLYPELDQLVTKAGKLVAAGRFSEALALYDDALQSHPHSVVPLDRTRAIGIQDYVHGRIAEWPEAGKEAYRRRVDGLFAESLETAKRTRDLDALERLAERHPFSSHVGPALSLVANLWLDAGEDARAAEALDRLLAAGAGADRPAAMAKLGLALSRLGRKAALEELAARAEAGARVTVGGEERELAPWLRALAARTKAGRVAPPLEIPAWEMMGGAPAGTKLAEPLADLPRLAWADTIGLPNYDQPEEFAFGRRGRSLGPHPEFRPLFPAVADGIVYVQNGSLVAAYNLFARRPERLWQYRARPPEGEVMFDDRVVYGVTVQDGRAFANLIAASGGSEVQLNYVQVKFPFPRRALHALDAYTGRLLWRKGGVLGADTLEENASFPTPPTPDGGRLYVGAVKQKLNTDPFEHYVMCLDPATGRTLWEKFVASGLTEINLFGNSTRESLGTPVSVSGDTVFYGTNHGVVAALDRRSGRLRWAFRYEQLSVNPTRSVYVQKNPLQWVNAPPLAAGGLVVFSPTDSSFLYALDAATGALRWKRARRQDLRSVYGARGNVLVVGGEGMELLDLRTGDPVAPPIPKAELRGTGRGVVGEDGILVAGQDKLRRVRWDGAWDEEQSRAWPGGEGEGGNLLVVDGALVVASQDGLQVYYDRRNQEQAIRVELATGADDPALLYRAALRFLQSGDPLEAAGLFQKVVQRTEKAGRPEDERLHRAARKRLFAVQMEAGRGDLEARRAAEAAARFRTARAAAADPASEIEASVLLGRALLAGGRDADAVAEYQRLLAEHGETTWEGKRVFDLARNAIGAIVATTGRAPYGKEEAAAQALLARARREGTGAAYGEVFRLYPNSLSAEEALFEAAQAQARLGRPDEEISAWRLFAREFGTSARAPEALARLVHALEGKGQFAAATAALRRLSRAFPEAEVPDGEGRVKARAFAERRLKSEAYLRASADTPLARLATPLGKPFGYVDKEFPEGAPLRVSGVPPGWAKDLLFMLYAGGRGAVLRGLDLRRRAEPWTLPVGNVELAAFVEEGLLVADDSSVRLVNPKKGEEWRYPAAEAPRQRLRKFTLSGSTLFFYTDDPRGEGALVLVALDAVRGTVLWAEAFEGIPFSRPLAAGDGVVLATVSPGRLHLFDAETGKRRLEAPFAPGLSAQVAHAAEDVVVLLAEGRFVEAYSLPEGTLRWRTSLAGVGTRGLDVAGGELLLLGVRARPGKDEDEAFLSVINLKSGKLVRVREKLESPDPRFMMVEGATAYVVFRERDATFTVRAVGLGDLSTRWEAKAGGGKKSTLLPPGLAKDHLVVASFEHREDGKYGYVGTLLDKQGRTVQNIRSAEGFERPPEATVANDAVIFSVDSRVEVHR